MRAWEILGREKTPDGAELVLARRGDELAIRVGGQLLMSSRQHGSEEVLAQVGCEAVKGASRPVILIGGLGMGYTLRAALDGLPRDSQVVVAELLAPVIGWNREVLAPLAGRPLEDARVEVVNADVRLVMQQNPRKFGAILLDVDNGPAALTSPANARLYGTKGVELAARALVPGGTLAVWSAAEDARYVKILERSGFSVRVQAVEARTGAGGPRHVLFIAKR